METKTHNMIFDNTVGDFTTTKKAMPKNILIRNCGQYLKRVTIMENIHIILSIKKDESGVESKSITLLNGEKIEDLCGEYRTEEKDGFIKIINAFSDYLLGHAGAINHFGQEILNRIK